MPYPPLLRASPGRPRYLRGVGWWAPVSEVELSGCSPSSFWGLCLQPFFYHRKDSLCSERWRARKFASSRYEDDECAPEPGSPRVSATLLRNSPRVPSHKPPPPIFKDPTTKKKRTPTSPSRCANSKPPSVAEPANPDVPLQGPARKLHSTINFYSICRPITLNPYKPRNRQAINPN